MAISRSSANSFKDISNVRSDGLWSTKQTLAWNGWAVQKEIPKLGSARLPTNGAMGEEPPKIVVQDKKKAENTSKNMYDKFYSKTVRANVGNTALISPVEINNPFGHVTLPPVLPLGI
jgi:hypothetical protein